MVAREQMIEEAREILAKAGFYNTERVNTYNMSFDVMSRRDDALLIVKVYLNADSIRKEGSGEMRLLSDFLKGSPIILSVKMSRKPLDDGVLYLRHHIPIMTLATFSDMLLEGVPPLVFAGPGGYYVNIDGPAVAELRNGKGLSLGALAEAIGVSRKSIQMYEQGTCPTVEVAMKLEKVLGQPLIRGLDPFDVEAPAPGTIPLHDIDAAHTDILSKFDNMGYEVAPTVKCPFNALSKDRFSLLLLGIGRTRGVAGRASLISNISQVSEKQAVLILETASKENIDGAPVIRYRELKKILSPEELMELIQERS